VDQNKGAVQLDEKFFSVASNQAYALFHLAEANGNTISGPAIAKKLGVSEFKLGRLVEQIKQCHPQLGAVIKKENKLNGGFYIELPPI
jgi:biotin operon repressor